MKRLFNILTLAIMLVSSVISMGIPTTTVHAASNWQTVGAAGFSAGSAYYTSLAMANGTPYVAYRDGGNGYKATVMKFDALSGNWVAVGAAGFSATDVGYISLALDNGTPYVAYGG